MRKEVGLKNLQKALLSDRHFSPERLNEMLKSEVFKCLCNFLELNEKKVQATLEVDEFGDFEFRFSAKAKRLKIVGLLPKEV